MGKHKNSNDAVGNYGIYIIFIDGITYKIGKADLDRITKSSGNPTRIHQQIRKLSLKYTEKNIFYRYLKRMLNVTTKEAKAFEEYFLNQYYMSNGTAPEGNQKSYKPKK